MERPGLIVIEPCLQGCGQFYGPAIERSEQSVPLFGERIEELSSVPATHLAGNQPFRFGRAEDLRHVRRGQPERLAQLSGTHLFAPGEGAQHHPFVQRNAIMRLEVGFETHYGPLQIADTAESIHCSRLCERPVCRSGACTSRIRYSVPGQ